MRMEKRHIELAKVPSPQTTSIGTARLISVLSDLVKPCALDRAHPTRLNLFFIVFRYFGEVLKSSKYA